MDQRICTVHIKEIFQVIFFVSCRILKDSLSTLTSLISVWGSKFIHKLILGNLNDSSQTYWGKQLPTTGEDI